MRKRQKFTITSIVLSFGFVGIQLLDTPARMWAIVGLAMASLLLFTWSLWEGLGKNATILTLVLPPLFSLGVGLFWFLLPTSVLARIPVVILYGLGIYGLCLTANIYTVGAIRTIALVRAAKGVGFVLTLVTFFLLFDSIYSVRSTILVTVAASVASAFPLFLQGLWASTLDKYVSKQILIYSVIFSLMVGEVAAAIYFWPVSLVVGSLFLTLSSYVLLGLGQAQVEGRLFPQTMREYLIVGTLVFVTMVIFTRWGGY